MLFHLAIGTSGTKKLKMEQTAQILENGTCGTKLPYS
jgi:hypothetical protein